MVLDNFLTGSRDNLLAFASPLSRVFWLYLASAAVLAVCSFVYFRFAARGERPEKVESGLFGFLFDRSVFLHRSAVQDYLYFAVNAVIYGGIISQALVALHLFEGVVTAGLNEVLGPRQAPLFQPDFTAAALWTLVSVLVADFALFLAHYLQHRYPVLWRFHQVHHSAEVLTPMTLFRMHPVDMILNSILAAFFGGLAIGSYVYFSDHAPNEVQIGSVNVVLFAFYLFGYNLRHSHVWLSYPRWLSYILISPAQHQTHHSVAAKHFDRNFGLIFSFWDWMFGTLYVPKGYEKLTFGVSRREPNPFPTVRALYLKPFREAWALLRARGWSGRARLAAAGALSVGALALAVVTIQQVRAGDYAPPSVHLEELTWTEVQSALDAGHDSVIVPTGGTEQNGPHVVLGKHNYIVRYTAGEIAQRLGKTLVAPVVSYVPEGKTGQDADGHMRFAGTLSLPEPVFEALLEAAIRSYATHGFRHVYLVGDSGGNQAAQARVAERMDGALDGVRVMQVGDYYAANGQVDWLRRQGFTDAEIGTHAGIRDTSELMAVHGGGVHDRPDGPGPEYGYNGNPGKASAEIGKTLLEMKIEAALNQIRGAGES